LWHAIDHQSGKVLAYVLATHEDSALKKLQQLLAPFAIERFGNESYNTQ
jgi:insertion element IS1 protein InsB